LHCALYEQVLKKYNKEISDITSFLQCRYLNHFAVQKYTIKLNKLH